MSDKICVIKEVKERNWEIRKREDDLKIVTLGLEDEGQSERHKMGQACSHERYCRRLSFVHYQFALCGFLFFRTIFVF